MLRAVAAFALVVALCNGQMDHMSGGGHTAGMMMPTADKGPRPPCVEDPTVKNCSDFNLPHPVVQGDLMDLCKAMNFMPGCSIFKACRAASPGPDDVAGNWTEAVSSNPDACRHLNLVATVCTHDTGMGMMKGCQNNFNSMCKNGSVVPKCKTMTGFPELPATKAVNAAVKELCTANRTRPGCTACLESFDANKTYGNCDLLGVWGDICKSEPKLPQCANATALCTQDPKWYFCSGSAVAASDAGWKLLTSRSDAVNSTTTANETVTMAANTTNVTSSAKSGAGEISSHVGMTLMAMAASWLLLLTVA